MPRSRTTAKLLRPGVLLTLLLLVISGLLAGTRSHSPSGLPPRFLLEANQRIAENPTSAFAYASRAWARNRHGQYERAIADIREAVRLNPNDVGKDYEPNTNEALFEAALRHGAEQVQKMFRDRPVMGKGIKTGDPIWKWAVRKFAGEDTGALVYWDATDPSPFGGMCVPAKHGRTSRILVAPTSVASPLPVSLFDHLWATAVFELHNISMATEFARLEQGAFDGNIDREDFIVAMIDVEKLAGQKTRAFFLDVFWPWCQSNEISRPDLYIWHCFDFHERAADLEYYRQTRHWTLYSDKFTVICINRSYQRGQYDEMARHLDDLRSRQQLLLPEHLVDLHYFAGCYLLTRDRVPDAIREFDRALTIAPGARLVQLVRAWSLYRNGSINESLQIFDQIVRNHGDWAEPRYYRAYVHAEAGESQKALADLDEAIRQEPTYDSLVLRANLLHEEGDTDLALKDLSAAINLEPERIDALKARGRIFAAQLKWAEAMADFEAAVRLSPNDAESYSYRAWGYLLTERYELAEGDFEHSLSLEPETAMALAGRAHLSIVQKDKLTPDWTRACEDARRSCELTNWQQADYINILAEACRESGDAEQAEKWRQKAREVGAESASSSSPGSEAPAVQPEAKDSSIVLPRAKCLLAAY